MPMVPGYPTGTDYPSSTEESSQDYGGNILSVRCFRVAKVLLPAAADDLLGGLFVWFGCFSVRSALRREVLRGQRHVHQFLQ